MRAQRRHALGLCTLTAFAASLGCVLVTGGTDGYRAKDAGAAECTDARITEPELPDAALGDSGATVASCVACVEESCGTEVATCQAECGCREAAIGFFRCLGAGATSSACSADAFGEGTSPGLLLLGSCLQQSACAASACGAGDGGS